MSDDRKNQSPLWKRILFTCLKSPVNTLFTLALLACVFYIYVLGNDGVSHKMLMLAIVLLWMLWFVAKYAFALILILALLGAGAYLYWDYGRQDIVKCEDSGGRWNSKTKQCEEKLSFFRKIEKLWVDSRT